VKAEICASGLAHRSASVGFGGFLFIRFVFAQGRVLVSAEQAGLPETSEASFEG